MSATMSSVNRANSEPIEQKTMNSILFTETVVKCFFVISAVCFWFSLMMNVFSIEVKEKKVHYL